LRFLTSALFYLFDNFTVKKKKKEKNIHYPDFPHILNFDLYLDSASRPLTMNWFRYLYIWISSFDSGHLLLHIALI